MFLTASMVEESASKLVFLSLEFPLDVLAEKVEVWDDVVDKPGVGAEPNLTGSPVTPWNDL